MKNSKDKTDLFIDELRDLLDKHKVFIDVDGGYGHPKTYTIRSEEADEKGRLPIYIDDFTELLGELNKKKDCSTCKFISKSKYVEPCFGCRDNDGFDHYKKHHSS